MPGILESVNQRTQIVGQNRLEMLLFRLNGPQLYGINVFKVREVITCPKLTLIPMRNPIVRGIAHVREGTISIIDLNAAIGGPELADVENSLLIITEYNMRVQGFLVNSVERIINKKWDSVLHPPETAGAEHYLTAITHSAGQLVEVLDVEKIIAEVIPVRTEVSSVLVDTKVVEAAADKLVLIVDDSMVARKQIKRCVEQLGASTVVLNDGKEALDHLRALVAAGEDVASKYLMMISDIEMPEMDGYTLTAAINEDERLAGLYILLHTSLSGIFNLEMVKKVGADDFLAKYFPDDLALKVIERIESVQRPTCANR